jgi:hypothetical protein
VRLQRLRSGAIGLLVTLYLLTFVQNLRGRARCKPITSAVASQLFPVYCANHSNEKGHSVSDDLISQFADMADSLSTVSDSKMQRLAELSREFAHLSRDIEATEEKLKTMKVRRYELETKELVDLMQDIGLTVTGVDDVQIVVERKCHANISKDWEDERRLAAFEHLRAIGGEDLIKNTLSVSAGRGSDDKMNQIRQRVVQMLAEVELDAAVTLEPTVAWNTLTSFVKSVVDAGETPVDLEAVGAVYAPVAKIVKPKKKGK